MDPWQSLLLALGGNAALLLVLGWLAKSLLSQILRKDLDRFKANLEAASTSSAENLKHKLSLAAHEHNVMFSDLHERRATVLEGTYQRLLDFEDAAGLMAFTSDNSTEGEIKTRLTTAETAGKELDRYIRRNRIYLPPDTCATLDELMNGIYSMLGDYSFGLLLKKLDQDPESVTS